LNFIQRALFKLAIKRKEMLETMEKGREVSRQMQDEKYRKKAEKILEGNPSAVNTMRKHLLMRTRNPLDVMKDEYMRRKEEREKD